MKGKWIELETRLMQLVYMGAAYTYPSENIEQFHCKLKELLVPTLVWEMKGKDNTVTSTTLGSNWIITQMIGHWKVEDFEGSLDECKLYCSIKTRDKYLNLCGLI